MINILVAEDFDLLREDLCELINSEPDMTIAGTAASGTEIVERALSTNFDIILMDVEMETQTAGIHAAEKILDQRPQAIVIFLTAHDNEQMILTSMAVGAKDYIVKGCEDQEILNHIRLAYQGNPMLDSHIQLTILKDFSRLRRSESNLLYFIQNVSRLTEIERLLIRMLLDGKKVKEIAEIRMVEVVTVKTQIKGLRKKFGTESTKEIIEMIHELNVAHLF